MGAYRRRHQRELTPIMRWLSAERPRRRMSDTHFASFVSERIIYNQSLPWQILASAASSVFVHQSVGCCARSTNAYISRFREIIGRGRIARDAAPKRPA